MAKLTLEQKMGTILCNIAKKLNESEIKFLKNWLNQDKQMKKLNDCLKSTVFSSHEIGKSAMRRVKQGNLLKEGGETFIVIKIPIVDRIE